MPPLAVTTLEKLQNVPSRFWINAAIFILAFVALIVIIKYIREMNKILLAIIVAAVFGVVGFNWIYERNEPEFLTPVVDVMAQFLPSKGIYENTQKKDPDEGKDKKKKAKTPTSSIR